MGKNRGSAGYYPRPALPLPKGAVLFNSDIEKYFRMCLSRLDMAHREIVTIRGTLFDNSDLIRADACLAEAIDYLAEARDTASRELGFTIKESV